MEFTFKELKEMLTNPESEVTETTSREVLSFKQVKAGDVGEDYNGEEWMVLKKGTAEDLVVNGNDPTGCIKDGIVDDYIDADEPCVLARNIKTDEVAAWVYGDDGVQVYVVVDDDESILEEDWSNHQPEEPDWVITNLETGEKDYVTAWTAESAISRSKFSNLPREQLKAECQD